MRTTDRSKNSGDACRQLAFVVRTLLVDGLPEAFSQQVDGDPGSDLRMADLFEAGWTVVQTESMPGGLESTCLVVLQAPTTPIPNKPHSQLSAEIPMPRSTFREPRQESMELHAPGLAAWDGETISLERLGIR